MVKHRTEIKTGPAVQAGRGGLKLREVLDLSVLKAVEIDIVTGRRNLDLEVRWAHVADSKRVGHLLQGGELLLTTGTGWGRSPSERKEQIESFVSAGAVALLVELGQTWSEVPPDVLEECRRWNLALLVAKEEVRFIAVVEAIHAQILNRQVEEITMMNSVAETMSALSYGEASTEEIVNQAGRLLQLPVVLEDPAHSVVCFSEGFLLPSVLLDRWNEKSLHWSRSLSKGRISVPTPLEDPFGQERWTALDIFSRGVVLGRLFYRGEPASSGVADYVLRHAAMAIAVERLNAPQRHSWSELVEKNAVRQLVGVKFRSVSDAAAVLTGAGFRSNDRVLFAAEIIHESAPLEVWKVRQALTRSSGAMVADLDLLINISEVDFRRITCAFSIPKGRSAGQVLNEVGELLWRKFGGKFVAISSGECAGVVELSIGVKSVREFASVEFTRSKFQIIPLSQAPIDQLMEQLRDDVRIQEFAFNTLDPLIEHDGKNGTDLLRTLRVVLAYPHSRSAAAEELHLSRTSLYSRIGLIESLLKVDILEEETFFALNLAIRALRRKS